MISRGRLIAALLVVELAIVGEAIVALGGGWNSMPVPHHMRALAATGSHLVEGGAHRIFDTAEHPAITVDIGYADLTIVTSTAPRIDVGLSGSAAYGVFRETAPISARDDGGVIRIAMARPRDMVVGDDRMVTVVVPADTQIRVVHAGDIKASGLRAEGSFTSTGNGSVTIDDYDAPALHVASSRGQIVLHRIVATRVDASSSDGRVEGTELQVHDGSVRGDGHVTLGFSSGSDALVSAQTSNGKVSVSGFTAAATGASDRTGGSEDGASRTVRVGAGDGRLDVRSNDGDITLAQEG